jgi:hypothetical protein
VIKQTLEQEVRTWGELGSPQITKRYVLKHGQVFDRIGTMHYKMGPHGQCFQNAYRLAEMHPELTYCEGFGMSETFGWPLLHAWCVAENGLVVDNTWRHTDVQYMGVKFEFEELSGIILCQEMYGVFGVDFENHKYLFEKDPELKLIATQLGQRRKELFDGL